MSRLSVAVLVVAVVLVTLCDARLIHDLAAANQGAAMETDYLANCPCSNKALCAPLTLGPRPELLMFQVSGENYMRYNWSKFDDDPDGILPYLDVRVVWSAYYKVTDLPNATMRAQWIASEIALVKSTYTDGINIDIESPIPQGSPLVPLLTQLVKEAKDAFRKHIPGAQVSVDFAWSPDCIDGRCYDFKGIADYSDFVVIMDYDERSQVKEGPCIASANSPPQNLIIGMAKFISLGIPKSKLLMGLPWYGYNYTCVNQTEEAVCPIKLVPFRGVNCSDAAGNEVDYSYIIKNLLPLSTTGYQWDDELQSPWFNYNLPSGQAMQVWFDDPRSISVKVQIAQKLELGGVAVWEADQLDYSNSSQVQSMWGALNNFFGTP